MRTFVLGDININKQKLEKRIKTRTKKLVKFFGEEYREFIEKKIGKTTFIVTERNSESLSSENEMENIIKNFLKSYLGDFIKYLPVEDLKRNSLYNDKFVLEIIDNLLYEKNFSVKNNIEFRALLIAFIQKRGGGYGIPMLFDEWIKANFNNPDYIKSLEEYLEQIGIDKIEDALFLSKNIWDTDLKKEYKIAKANFYETYFSKLKFRLNDNEILCTEELEKQFGKKIREIVLNENYFTNSNIAKVCLKFFTINREFMHSNDVEDFEKMFELLTGEKKELEEYLKDETLMNKIDKVNRIVGKKLKKRRKTNDNLETIRKYYEDEHLDNFDEHLKTLSDYIEFKYKAGAYFSPGEKSNGEIYHSIILPEFVTTDLTHEMVHSAFQSQSDSWVTGIGKIYEHRGLNEVLTEYFACLIENDTDYTYFSRRYNTYSAAFPLLKNFLKNNLDVLKRCYAKHNLEELADLIGAENLDKLSECLDNLLYTEPTKHFTAVKIKREMRKKEEIPAIEELKNLMNEIEAKLSV